MALHVFFKKSRRGEIEPFVKRFNEVFGCGFNLEESLSFESGKEFRLEVLNNGGYFRINNPGDAFVFGDVEADIFPNKIKPNEVSDFFDAIKEGYFPREKLDELFSGFRHCLVRAYVDIEGDGGSNPLDVLYEYNSKGSQLFIKLVRALEVLSGEDEELEELYESIRENSNPSLMSSRLWGDDYIRNLAISLAKEKNIMAQEGSLRIYAEDKEKLKEYYKEMIERILKPLFEDIEPFDERMKRIV